MFLLFKSPSRHLLSCSLLVIGQTIFIAVLVVNCYQSVSLGLFYDLGQFLAGQLRFNYVNFCFNENWYYQLPARV